MAIEISSTLSQTPWLWLVHAIRTMLMPRVHQFYICIYVHGHRTVIAQSLEFKFKHYTDILYKTFRGDSLIWASDEKSWQNRKTH